MMEHILVVDDDKEIVNLIHIYLENEGFKVFKAFNGEEAIDIFKKEEVHLIIIDNMMPKKTGIEVIKDLRENHHTPILMLSAKSEDIDKITGLTVGADDYLTKPFNPLELVTRVKTLMRRAYRYQDKSMGKNDDVIQINGLEINKKLHTAKANNELIQLTAKEFEILYVLATNPGKVFSSEDLFLIVWKERYYSSNNTVMVHMSNLREKLERALGHKIIKTIWGVGYKIDDE
ncbi:response regulator transcription factor [Chengkuizengella axinellae]|uniref:Response regulator transcription factor n=1 Tax=Chengkuizengella axinellae TaxID=3064388 RepID=A0ABT9J093_9BACL|nr:response regulator transcription factor [Chengkuizengella sp. 2205SS18-9]MDP5275034.1 response regulator transcription factor [Chengkuizengella sp. 2205SS18-9]